MQPPSSHIDLRTQQILTGPILPVLLRMSLPNMMAFIVQASVSMTEVWYIGQLGTTSLAAIALVFPALMLMQMLANGAIGGAVTSAIARAIGRGDHETAEQLIWHALAIAIAAGGCFMFLYLLFGNSLFTLFNASAEAKSQANTYAIILFCGCISLWCMAMLSSVYRGMGNMALPALLMLVGASLQIPLSGALILGWFGITSMGIAGAAVSIIIVASLSSINLIYQFWVHTEHIRRLGFWEWFFVTPSNHRVHHARNPDYLDKNYAGVFILWDRMFGTFKDEREEEPCVYGITSGLNSWNPFWANFHVWFDTASISWKTAKPWDKIRVWFKGPGWYPDDIPVKNKAEWQQPKYDPKISVFAGVYAFIQLWVLIGASLWLASNNSEFPRVMVLSFTFWLGFSFYVHGTWIEARSFAVKLEWFRLALVLLLMPVCFLLWSEMPKLMLQYAFVYALLSATAVVASRWLPNKQLSGLRETATL